MTMQTDVLSAHLNATGLMVNYRCRLKSIISIGSSTAGTVNFYDDTVGPTSVTYGRSGTTVTVTNNNHGLNTGDSVGLYFTAGTGGQATSGNYYITKLTANTYTITDLNSGSITAGATAYQSKRFLLSIDTNAASDITTLLLPGEGMLAQNGIYAGLSNQTGITIFYA